MSLHQHLAMLEDRARLAMRILDGTATHRDEAAFRASLSLEPHDETELEADEYLDSGYAFTRGPDSPVVAVLSVGAPDVQLVRDGSDYALTGYSPGHRDARLSTPTINRWGRMVDRDEDGHGYVCKRCGDPAPMGIGYTDPRIGARAASQAVTACTCRYSRA